MILNPYAFAAAGYDSDAAAGIIAAGLTNSTEKAAAVALVVGLKDAGIWPLLRAAYFMLGGNAASHAVNWVSPGTYDLTWHGGITHSATGVAWNGTTGYADTGFAPSGVLTQNSEHYSYYSRSTSIANGYDIGGAHNTGQFQWSGLGTYANQFSAYINNANTSTATVTVTIASGSGLWVGSRTSSTALSAYRNGSSIGANTNSNIWVQSTRTIFLGATNVSGTPTQFSSREMAFASIGDGLTAGQVSDLYDLVQAFQTALGRQV